MNDWNHTPTSAELDRIEARLRAEKGTASALELDRIKLQVIRRVEHPRPRVLAHKKGTFMKSKLALTLLLVAGFMLSTTGAGLAISGSSGSGSAATSQYLAPTNEGGNNSEGAVKGAHAEGGGENNTLQPEAQVESAPAPAAAQQAVVSSDSSLPFTGFVAIPLLAIGIAMLLIGVVLALRTRRRPLTRH